MSVLLGVGALGIGAAGPALPVQAAAAPASALGVPEDVPLGFYQTQQGVMWSNGDGTFKVDEFVVHEGKTWYVAADGLIQLPGQESTDTFDPAYYYRRYPDVAKEMGNDPNLLYVHYKMFGASEHRFPNEAAELAQTGQVDYPAETAETAEAAVTPFEQMVRNYLSACTDETMTQDQKLWAAYNYICDQTTYKRTYEKPSGDWLQSYATDVYTTGKGNCYRYAAAFAFMAKELGYDVTVRTGKIEAARGGVTPHCWVIIRDQNGAEYICDPEMADAKNNRAGLYMKTFAQYPYKPLIGEADWEVKF